jgi:putative ABC transport system permease protein
VSTAFGFELAADSKGRQLMSALGIAGRSRAGIIGTELGVVSLYGGGLGVFIWGVGALLVNQVTIARFGAPVATLDPRFAAYGIGVALLIGLLSLPYLLVVDWRSRGEVNLR